MHDRASSFRHLEYIDPEPFLVRLHALDKRVSRSKLARKVRTLRTQELKPWREVREGALFAYALGQRLGQRVLVAKAPAENLDYDCVTRRDGPNETVFYGAEQVKEVVPHHLNRTATVQQVIDKLTRYASPGLSVVIHLNRLAQFDPPALKIPQLRLSTLWIMAAFAPDQSRWGLWGDFLNGDLGLVEFDYPTSL